MDNLEYSYHDESMLELGINPSDLELIVPRFVIRDRARDIAYWAEKMDEATAKLEQSEMEQQGAPLSPEEALLIIQRHERARQGRLRAKLMLEIRKQEASERAKSSKAAESISSALAANKIQSIWKGALARRKVRKQREEELAFIGMVSGKTITKYHAIKNNRLHKLYK